MSSTIVETAVTGKINNAQESLGTPNKFLQTYLDTAPTLTITPDSLDPVILFAGKAPPAVQRGLLSPSFNTTTGHRSSTDEHALFLHACISTTGIASSAMHTCVTGNCCRHSAADGRNHTLQQPYHGLKCIKSILCTPKSQAQRRCQTFARVTEDMHARGRSIFDCRCLVL